MRNTGWESSDESSDSSPEQNLEADTWIRNLRGEDVAQQLSDLHLGRGAIRRTSMGGSMRMPVQPSLRDNNISGARHSTDQSYEASSRSRSGLSTSSQEEPITRQPKKKGFFAAAAHKVKKAFAQRSGKKSSKDWTREPETVVETTFRVDHAKKQPAGSADDQRLIDEAVATATGNDYAESYIATNRSALRRLSGELNSRGSSLTQLSDQQLRAYVDAELEGGAYYKKALRMLQNHRDTLPLEERYQPMDQAPPPTRTGAVRRPSPEDLALINKAMETARGRLAPVTISQYATPLRRLAEALRYCGQSLTGIENATRLKNRVAELGLDSPEMAGGLRMLESHREAQRTQNSQDVGGSLQPFPWQVVVPRSQIDPSSEVPAIAPYSNTFGWPDGSQQNWQEDVAAGFLGYAPPPPQIDPSSDGWQQNWHFTRP